MQLNKINFFKIPKIHFSIKCFLLISAFFALSGYANNTQVQEHIEARLYEQSSDKQLVLHGRALGTSYSVRYYPERLTPDPIAIQSGIDKAVQQITHQMSTYIPDSELSLFNQSKAINQPFQIDQDVITVIREAQRIHQLTQGGLDITLSPVIELWGFGPAIRPQTIPLDQAIQQRMHWTGMDKLQLTSTALIKTIPELSLDLSAIAKGYTVDVVGRYLESQSIKNYLIEIGGEVRARGLTDGRLWRVGIQMPDDDFSVHLKKVVELNNLSMATSGDYHNYYDSDGVRYSHTIDPKTGKPLQSQITSITVIASDCMEADGLATGLYVMGVDQGMKLANEKGIAVFMLLRTAHGLEEHRSIAFEQLLGK